MTSTGLRKFNVEEAKQIGTEVGINWETSLFGPAQFAEGLHVELEHGVHDPETDVSGDNPAITAKIAWAHLKEFPDYYVRLEKMEQEAKAYWKEKNKENG